MTKWNHNGIEITIDNLGKFNATIDDDTEIQATSLEEIKKKLDRIPKAKRLVDLPVLILGHNKGQFGIIETSIIGVNRTTCEVRFKDNEIKNKFPLIKRVLVNTTSNRLLLGLVRDLNNLLTPIEKHLQSQPDLQRRGWGQIDPTRYESIVMSMEKDYQKAVELGQEQVATVLHGADVAISKLVESLSLKDFSA